MAGAVACLCLLACAPLAGCSGDVEVGGPTSGPAECRALLTAVPETVDGRRQRPVEPRNALAAAWGDPPIVLRCGVAEPSALRPSSACAEINNVGWFTRRGEGGFTFTTIGRSTPVQVRVPYDYEPAADALVDVAAAIRRTVPEILPCV
jgi:hypothetical protein